MTDLWGLVSWRGISLGSFNSARPHDRQFSFWTCLSPPGEVTRPTCATKPPACRPGALTRRPDLVHSENCCLMIGLVVASSEEAWVGAFVNGSVLAGRDNP